MRDLILRGLAAFFLAFFSSMAGAQNGLQPGRDFAVINPAQLTDSPDKIEVLEFFSYACPHCGDLNSHLVRWAGKQPAGVVVHRVPVSFGPFYQLMARLYYSLEAMGELSRLDGAVFAAVHEKGLKLVNEKSIRDWLVDQGVDARKFSDAFNSFGVLSKTRRAQELADQYKIRGVPSLAVDGRYLVVGQAVKSHEELLALTDKIIAKRRAERSGKK